MTTTATQTIGTELARCNPNRLPDALQALNLYNFVSALLDVTGETVAVVAHVGALVGVALCVQNVYATVGGSVGAKAVVPAPIVPGAGQVQIGADQRTLTFAAADAVTEARVFYVAKPNCAALTTALPV